MAARSRRDADGEPTPAPRSALSAARRQWLAFSMSVFSLFFLYFGLRQETPAPTSTIRVTAETSRELAAEREAVLGRAITAGELDLLVQSYVDDEILVREARKRGIRCTGCDGRRHLVKRLLFAVGESPSEVRAGDVEAFFEQRRTDYEVPERLSFEHLYFATEPTPAVLSEALRAKRAGRNPKADPLGDPFWLGSRIDMITRAELEATLGATFGNQVFAGGDNEWFGPLRSARGVHLVRVLQRSPARAATLEEIRLQVRQDLERHRRILTRQRLLARFRNAHEIVIEAPDGAA